jgi:hypothetical protein
VGEADYCYDLALSNDGRKVAVTIGKDAGDIWLHDLDRDVRTRFTFDPADDTCVLTRRLPSGFLLGPEGPGSALLERHLRLAPTVSASW